MRPERHGKLMVFKIRTNTPGISALYSPYLPLLVASDRTIYPGYVVIIQPGVNDMIVVIVTFPSENPTALRHPSY